MSLVRLGDVCEVTTGQAAPQIPDAFSSSGVPFVRAGSLQALCAGSSESSLELIQPANAKRFRLRLFPEDTVVFAKSGMSANLGRVHRLSQDCYLVSHLAAVLPSPAVDPGYLHRWFECNPASRLITNEAYPSIKTSTIQDIRVPLPPLPEQRRIAAILDKADALRAKRRQAIAKLDLLLQSVFLEMFGDPVTNPKGWPMVHVGDAFSAFVGGKNVECPDSGSSPYRILKVSAVTKTVFMPDQSKLAPDGLIPASEHIVRNGDLLFSRANTAELVAATAYVWETPPNLVLPDKIWRMVLRDESKLIPLFAWELFKNRAFRDELSKRSSGTSGSMKNISKAKLMLVPMPLPPLELQNKLALLSRRLHQQRAWLERQQSGLDQVQTAIATSAFAS